MKAGVLDRSAHGDDRAVAFWATAISVVLGTMLAFGLELPATPVRVGWDLADGVVVTDRGAATDQPAPTPSLMQP